MPGIVRGRDEASGDHRVHSSMAQRRVLTAFRSLLHNSYEYLSRHPDGSCMVLEQD